MEVTRLPGAYEEETEALRFLDGFGTPPCLCELLLHDGAERHRTGGRQGCCLLPAPRRGSKCGAEPPVESQSQERKGWLTRVLGRLGGCQPERRRPWGKGMCCVWGCALSQPHGCSRTPRHPLLCACVGRSRQRMVDGRSGGLGEPMKQPLPPLHPGWLGLGGAGGCAHHPAHCQGSSPVPCSVRTCLKLMPPAFELVSEL